MSKRKQPAPHKPAPEPTPADPRTDPAPERPHGTRPDGTRPRRHDATTRPPPAEVDYDDHDLLGQADWVIGGEAARKARQQGLYAGYVLFLGALVYGLPIIQAVFRTSDATLAR